MHIVAVDPSRTALTVISRLLESDGHVVSAFVDGHEALAFIASRPDVATLITSGELGSMSGLELCWETRLLAGLDRAIYIILMSSSSGRQHLINALDGGADEFIQKPPVIEELYARLRSAERSLRLQSELIRLATVDPLTGVFNRRAFFDRAQRLCGSVSPAVHLAAIMFDVDHFKKVNDTYGHDAGDQVLRTVGGKTLADGSLIGRLGGEEFAVLLEASGLEDAVEYAERLRARLAAQPFPTMRGELSVTCSFGVAEWQADETIDDLLKRADAALYEAKNSGRNRVVAARRAGLGAEEAVWSGVLRSDLRPAAGARDGRAPVLPRNLPLAHWSSETEESMSSPADNNASEPAPSSAFVLDDEPEIAALICKVLGVCGLPARQFTAPAPFLEELKSAPPDLVVLDLSLGQSDAVEIIRHLKTTKYQGKVLLISGRDEATLKNITQIGEKHGLAMLPPLKKPFRPGDVKQRLAGYVADAKRSAARPAEGKPATEKKVTIQAVEALHNNWLEMWYQPKIDLKSAAVCGAEALLRAKHPTHGLLLPESILPPVGNPDYQPLTKFVLDRAMADWLRFAQQAIVLKLSINAPVSVIHTPAFVGLIRSALLKHPKFPGLTVEVTEDEVVRDSEWAHEVASQLRLYNVDLSIDDFGSGYASLSRLNDLPFAEIKIDRSFVSGCGSNQLKHNLCQTVVDLAHRFGATACAEGVETVEDLRALAAMRCDTGQGFIFAKAMPAANFITAVTSGAPGKAIRELQQASGNEDNRLAQIA
jgi:two-component system, cell cycle response regulator